MLSTVQTDNDRQTVDLISLQLNDRQFHQISRIVYEISGIDLHDGKQELVKARLLKRLRALRMRSFGSYMKYLENDRTGQELTAMVDVLTTNKTNFYREPEHLRYMCDTVIPAMGKANLTMWSAGCSSGEEPYSIAIALHEAIPGIKGREVRILATDISDRMLARAKAAVYEEDAVRQIDPKLRQKYFTCVETRRPRQYQVVPDVRNMIHFAKLNLMEQWPMAGPFDIIYCRNVMIYFDKQTQEQLVKRFWSLLRNDGYLFVGHSESLTFLAHDYRYIKPAVYRKIRPGTAKPAQRSA
jgi:chemotaxis protein methyltransferase CheR